MPVRLAHILGIVSQNVVEPVEVDVAGRAHARRRFGHTTGAPSEPGFRGRNPARRAQKVRNPSVHTVSVLIVRSDNGDVRKTVAIEIAYAREVGAKMREVGAAKPTCGRCRNNAGSRTAKQGGVALFALAVGTGMVRGADEHVPVAVAVHVTRTGHRVAELRAGNPACQSADGRGAHT